MVFFLLFLAALAIFALHRRANDLTRRLSELERRFEALSPAPAPEPGLAERPEAEAVPRSPLPEASEAAASPESIAASTPASEPPPLPPPLPPAAPAKPGFEETLGSRWAVWVGGLALALGGVFLVRYSIEMGLLGPGTRVVLGLVMAAVLMGAGEWLRRREAPVAIAQFRHANIPAILTAAGTSTAFAAIYAAYGLYGLIGPAAGFVGLGLVSLLTMTAAILHGPALAALGLVAALASPLLVESQEPAPVAMVLYLAFAVGTAYAVARLRLWRWLAIAAATGAILWGFMLLFLGQEWLSGTVAHIAVQLALALLFLVVDPYRHQAPEEATLDRLVTIPLVFFAVLAGIAASQFGPGLGRPAFMGAVVLAMGLVACRHPAGAGGLVAAGLAAVLLLAGWPVAREAASEPQRLIADLASAPYPDALVLFCTAAAIIPGTVAVLGLVRLRLGGRLRLGPAGFYAGALTLTPLAALVVAYWRITYFDHSIPFAILAGALGLAFAGSAAWLRRSDPDLANPVLGLAVGATASAAVAALAAGLTFALDRGVLTVTLALSALGTAIVADRVRVPALRAVVCALGLAVVGRLAWAPSVNPGAIGTTPIFNWLLWGYGVPALAFWASARILERRGRDKIVQFVEALALLFAALLIFLELRHYLYDGDPFAQRTGHLEAGLVATEALGFSLLLVRLDLFRPESFYRYGSLILGGLAMAGAAASLFVLDNPFLFGDSVIGGPVLNSLLPAYLLPACMAAALAWWARPNRPRAFVFAAAGLAVALVLAYASLEVRRLFHPGGHIDLFRSTSDEEIWCYSLVLLGMAFALFAVGILRRMKAARLAALAFLVAAVLKVFLIDLSALEGLTRALSFVGLGLALVAVGFVYQRLVTPRAGGEGQAG